MHPRLSRQLPAFTLIEMVVVILVLGILAAVAVAGYTQITSHARVSAVTANLRTAGTAVVAALAGDPDEGLSRTLVQDTLADALAVTVEPGLGAAPTIRLGYCDERPEVSTDYAVGFDNHDGHPNDDAGERATLLAAAGDGRVYGQFITRDGLEGPVFLVEQGYTPGDVLADSSPIPVVWAAPTALTVTATGDTPVATWVAAPGAKSYTLTARPVDGGAVQAWATTGTSQALTGLTNGVAYNITVTGHYPGQETVETAAVLFVAGPAGPPEVGPPTVEVVGGIAQVTWSPAEGATSYIVSLGLEGGSAVSHAVTGTSTTFTPLVSGGRYTVTVVARFPDDLTSSASTSFTAPVLAPDAPVLTANLSASSGVLSWPAVPNASTYTVERSTYKITGAAQFNLPGGMDVDADGNVYVADRGNNRIRKVTPNGVVTTVAGSTAGSTDGTGANAQLQWPTDVAVGPDGHIYFTEAYRVRKVTPEGVVTTIAGSGVSECKQGTGLEAGFASLLAIDVASNGDIYVTGADQTVRKITPDGVVSLVAGACGASGSTDGAGTVARFNNPQALTITPAGKLYVGDRYRVRAISATGWVTTHYGTYGSQTPLYIVGSLESDASGAVYAASQQNHTIVKITAPGQATTLMSSTLTYPSGLAIRADGSLLVTNNLHRIRTLSPTGTLGSLAGTDSSGYADTTATIGTPAVIYSGPNLGWTDSGLVAGTEYTYTVRAANDSGTSAGSNQVTLRP